jgi:hypothetical protein
MVVKRRIARMCLIQIPEAVGRCPESNLFNLRMFMVSHSNRHEPLSTHGLNPKDFAK